MTDAYIGFFCLIEGPQPHVLGYVPEIIVDSLYGTRVGDEVIDIVFSVKCYGSFQNPVEKLSIIGPTMRRSKEVDGVETRSQILSAGVMPSKDTSL